MKKLDPLLLQGNPVFVVTMLEPSSTSYDERKTAPYLHRIVGGRELPRYYGTIAHTPAALRKLIKEIGPASSLAFCYEAGPTGYETHRWIESMGASCTVIAPSLMPKRPGDHVKTDRRDAEQLARLFRAGELTAVHIPSRDDEALRDLVRTREAAKEDAHRARQRILKLLCVIRFIHRRRSNAAGQRNTGFGSLHLHSNTGRCKLCLRKCCMRSRRLSIA